MSESLIDGGEIMANVTADVFRIISSYGGLKTAYIEVDSMDSGDVIVLSDNNVKGIKYLNLVEEDSTNGKGALVFLVDAYELDSSTYANKATLKTGSKTKIKVSGIIVYRDY